MLKPLVARKPQGYIGYVAVYSGTRYLYSEESKVCRISELDAYADAKILMKELLRLDNIKGE